MVPAMPEESTCVKRGIVETLLFRLNHCEIPIGSSEQALANESAGLQDGTSENSKFSAQNLITIPAPNRRLFS
jgi:hypothetical protein